MERDLKKYKKDNQGRKAQKFKSTIKKRFGNFHSKSRKIKIKVAKKMRKKFTGKQAFSLKFKKYSDAINFWKRMLKLKKNVNTSRTILRRLAKRLKISWPIASVIGIVECKTKLKEAYKNYHEQKPNFVK